MNLSILVFCRGEGGRDEPAVGGEQCGHQLDLLDPHRCLAQGLGCDGRHRRRHERCEHID